MTKKLPIILTFFSFVVLIGCGAADSESGMNDDNPPDDDDPGFEFITYAPPQTNRATLVASHQLVDESKADSVFIRDSWGFRINNEKYIAIGTSLESSNGLIDLILHIINVSNPENPTTVSTVSEINAQDIKFWNGYLYTVTGQHEEEGGNIIDLSDPANPVLAGNFESAHNIFIDDNGLLYLTGSSTQIYDLNNDPLNPSLISSLEDTGSHDITVENGTLYVFSGLNDPSVLWYDISSPGSPAPITEFFSEYIFFSHSGWPTADGNYLLVADEYAIDDEADFTIWDISGDTPTLVNGFSDPDATVHNIMVTGNYAYMSYYSAGFRIFDITNPENPLLIGEVDTSPFSGETVVSRSGTRNSISISLEIRGAWGIYAGFNDGHAYISDVNTGLHIIKIE